MPLRPPALLSLVLLPTAVFFAWLGQWQLDRKLDKQRMLDSYAAAPEMEYSQAALRDFDYIRVRSSGQYRQDWYLLIDNKVHLGQAGVHVLSLFKPDSGQPFLVNRGWMPIGPDRNLLPLIPANPGRKQITGMLVKPTEDGVRLGDPEQLSGMQGTRLVTYLDMEQVKLALDGQVASRILLLDADDHSGFDGREWKPAVITPEQHGAYAVQWFAMALAILIIWITLGWRRGRNGTSRNQDNSNPPGSL